MLARCHLRARLCILVCAVSINETAARFLTVAPFLYPLPLLRRCKPRTATMATERYTCHEDGSTDCPCLVAEKTIKLIGMTVRRAQTDAAPRMRGGWRHVFVLFLRALLCLRLFATRGSPARRRPLLAGGLAEVYNCTGRVQELLHVRPLEEFPAVCVVQRAPFRRTAAFQRLTSRITYCHPRRRRLAQGAQCCARHLVQVDQGGGGGA